MAYKVEKTISFEQLQQLFGVSKPTACWWVISRQAVATQGGYNLHETLLKVIDKISYHHFRLLCDELDADPKQVLKTYYKRAYNFEYGTTEPAQE